MGENIIALLSDPCNMLLSSAEVLSLSDLFFFCKVYFFLTSSLALVATQAIPFLILYILSAGRYYKNVFLV